MRFNQDGSASMKEGVGVPLAFAGSCSRASARAARNHPPQRPRAQAL